MCFVAVKLGRRLGGGSAYWPIGVWGSKTAFLYDHSDREADEVDDAFKQPHSDTAIRFPAKGKKNAIGHVMSPA